MLIDSFEKAPLKKIAVSILKVKEKSRRHLCILFFFPAFDISQEGYESCSKVGLCIVLYLMCLPACLGQWLDRQEQNELAQVQIKLVV